MYYQSQYNHLIVRITKGYNSHNTDPTAPYPQHMHCVMVQVWCTFIKIGEKAFKL